MLRTRCAAPRRLCPLQLLLLLLLLLQVTWAASGAAAAGLHRRDKVDLLDSHKGGEDPVQDISLYCKKCPPGTYVAAHCEEPFGLSTCQPCKDEEFIEYPNDFPKCLDCTTCREDQVELSPCKATRDRQCICRNGTFCSPDHPCEMCQKCRPRCPQDEVEQAPCTPYSDRRCGPPTSTPGLSAGVITAIVLGSGATVILLALCCIWLCGCCSLPGNRRDLSGKSCNMVNYLLRWLTSRGTATETRDNIHNQRVSQDQPLLPRPGGAVNPSAPGLEGVVSTTSSPSEKPRKKLVPVEGKDPITILRRSFDTFAQDVPCKDWKRFGRALDLLENDIALAEMNDRYSLEPFFQMLNTWQNTQGMKASVNTLLEALHRINLGGIAEDISSKLVQQGSFQYEVS